MKPLVWIAIVFGFLLVAQWWRHEALQDEVAELRRETAATHSLLDSARATAPSTVAPETPIVSAPAPTARIGVPVEEPADVQIDRIEELERVVNAQADLIEQLMGRFELQDEKQRKALARGWGPEQATGPPDTATAGDFSTAWAPASSDGGVEWVEATFANPADIAKLIVRQTSNPGAITKVVAVMDTGTEVPVWTGDDPSAGQALADIPFAFPAGIKASRVRVYLDTSKKPGWEEIDALQLIGRDGSQQWAKSVSASSTYGGGSPGAFSANYMLDLNTSIKGAKPNAVLLIDQF